MSLACSSPVPLLGNTILSVLQPCVCVYACVYNKVPFNRSWMHRQSEGGVCVWLVWMCVWTFEMFTCVCVCFLQVCKWENIHGGCCRCSWGSQRRNIHHRLVVSVCLSVCAEMRFERMGFPLSICVCVCVWVSECSECTWRSPLEEVFWSNRSVTNCGSNYCYTSTDTHINTTIGRGLSESIWM